MAGEGRAISKTLSPAQSSNLCSYCKNAIFCTVHLYIHVTHVHVISCARRIWHTDIYARWFVWFYFFMLFLAATGIHRGKKQCQIFLRLLGWNDKPPTPIQIIQACAVAAFEKLCGAQMSWLPNVPEMELYDGAVFLCFSVIPRSIPKLPDAKNDEHPWELGYAIHTDHRKWFQKCRPEQTKTPDLPLRAAAQFKHKKQIGCDMMWPNSFNNRVGFRSHQISRASQHPSRQSAAPYRPYLAFATAPWTARWQTMTRFALWRSWATCRGQMGDSSDSRFYLGMFCSILGPCFFNFFLKAVFGCVRDVWAPVKQMVIAIQA